MTSSLAGEVREFTWRVRQAAQERLVIPILDADGAPKDVTGWTVDAKIKTQPGGTVLYTWPVDDVEIDGSDVELNIPAPVSATWTWGTSWYRVKLVAPNPSVDDPIVSRVLQGAIVLDFD